MIENTLNSQKNINKGLDFLSKKDPNLANLIRSIHDFSFPKRNTGFEALLKIIISQQLSTIAANSIWNRLIDNDLISKINILGASEQILLSNGLSRQKCTYVKALANEDINYDDLAKKSSEEVISRLTQIKGIGKWTAQIYCLFSLGQANIFPSGDLALQESIKIVFGLEVRPSEQEVIKMSENWHPWKSLAAHLLWVYYNKIKKKE
ncbi:MAG: DNA-3-methyladenine glycosylase family protein [Paracoccaceae bacterium]